MDKKLKKETKQKIVGTIFNVLNIFFALIIIALGFISIFNKPLLLDIFAWFEVIIQDVGDWNYLIAFSSSLIEAFPVLGVVVPGQNIMLLVAVFFAKKSWATLIGIYIMAIVGAVIGNYIGYALGKKYGDSFFEKYGIRFGVGLTEVKYLKQGINKWGPIGITFGKFHNVTRAFLPFIAGSMGMKQKSFFLYNVIGSVLRAITIVTIGAVFGKHYEVIINHLGKIIIFIMIGVLVYLYFFKKEQLKTYIKEKNEELNNL